MKSTKKLTILVDALLHQRLVELAQREHRSLQGQVTYLLAQALGGGVIASNGRTRDADEHVLSSDTADDGERTG